MKLNSTINNSGDGNALDNQIDDDASIVDTQLAKMVEFYGQESLDKMNPQDFYTNYKKFASGQTF